MKYPILIGLAIVAMLSIQLFAGSTEDAIEKLKVAKVDVDYDQLSLEDVLDDLKNKTGISVVIDKKTAEEIDIDDIEITLKLYDVSGYDLLMTVARFAELKVVFKYGMGWLVAPEHYYDGRNVVKIYDVRDITMKITDFPGISVRLKGNSTGSDNDVIWHEDDDNYDPIVDPDDLEEIIPEFVADGKWNENPGASIQQLGGMLIIRQAPEVHYEILKFLAEIRRNS